MRSSARRLEKDPVGCLRRTLPHRCAEHRRTAQRRACRAPGSGVPALESVGRPLIHYPAGCARRRRHHVHAIAAKTAQAPNARRSRSYSRK